jgi:hypothetical protein
MSPPTALYWLGDAVFGARKIVALLGWFFVAVAMLHAAATYWWRPVLGSPLANVLNVWDQVLLFLWA